MQCTTFGLDYIPFSFLLFLCCFFLFIRFSWCFLYWMHATTFYSLSTYYCILFVKRYDGNESKFTPYRLNSFACERKPHVICNFWSKFIRMIRVSWVNVCLSYRMHDFLSICMLYLVEMTINCKVYSHMLITYKALRLCADSVTTRNVMFSLSWLQPLTRCSHNNVYKVDLENGCYSWNFISNFKLPRDNCMNFSEKKYGYQVAKNARFWNNQIANITSQCFFCFSTINRFNKEPSGGNTAQSKLLCKMSHWHFTSSFV